MELFSFKSIKNKLVFWFLIIALFPLLIALIITYIQRVNVIETRTFDKLTAIRDLKVEQLQSWLAERVGDMGVLSEDYELESLENLINIDNKTQNAKNTLDKIRHYLTHYIGFYNAYDKLYIINPYTGIVLVSTDKSLEGYDKSKDDSYTIPMELQELSIKDIHLSETSSKNALEYSIPVFCDKHSGQHIIGILVASIDLQNSLYKLLQDRVGLGKTGETLIVNKNVVALNELRWYDNAPLNLQIFAEPAVYAAQGKTGITITTDYRGEKILAAYTYIPETDWGFVCKQDLYELNAPIRDMILNFVLLFFSSTFIIYITALFVAKTISKPIIEMDKLAKKIQSGNLSIRNVVNSQDELGSLATSINKMTNSIESKNTIQTGITDISETMIGLSSLQEFGSKLLKQLMDTTGSNMGIFYILDEMTSEFVHFASIKANKELLKPFKAENPEGEIGNAISKKRIYYLKDFPKDTIFKYQTTAGDVIPKEIITIPILVEDSVVALISLVSIHKFDKECYDILEQSWININSSYSGLISNERTKILAETLSTTNQKLESQTKELQQASFELQEQNTELDLQRYEVEKANKELTAFSYSVSHDLRAPLRAIDGFTRILIEDYASKLDKEGKRLGSVIQRNAKKMGKLIDDLLAFSRLGRTSMTYSKIDMGNMVNAIYHEVTSAEERKRIKFNVTSLPQVEGDTNLMRQVWINLISNAVKFSSQRKQAIISVTFKEGKNKVTYCIKDNGVGFNMKYVDKLFGVFQRLHSEKEFEGTGVGLALVQRIINRHDGKVWVEGNLNKGAEFYFSLPNKNRKT